MRATTTTTSVTTGLAAGAEPRPRSPVGLRAGASPDTYLTAILAAHRARAAGRRTATSTTSWPGPRRVLGTAASVRRAPLSVIRPGRAPWR